MGMGAPAGVLGGLLGRVLGVFGLLNTPSRAPWPPATGHWPLAGRAGHWLGVLATPCACSRRLLTAPDGVLAALGLLSTLSHPFQCHYSASWAY